MRLPWTKPYGYKNDKGMFVHLIGDDLGDSQTKFIWGKIVKELDKETQEKGVTFTLSKLNENPVLLISAVSLDKLIYEMNSNEQLKQTIIEFKRSKQLIPSKQIHIPAPGEKIEIDTKNEHSQVAIKNKVIQIVMDQKALELDVSPQMIKGRTLVPLRGIFEKYGAEVNYDSNSQIIKAKKETTNVKLIIGKASAVVNE